MVLTPGCGSDPVIEDIQAETEPTLLVFSVAINGDIAQTCRKSLIFRIVTEITFLVTYFLLGFNLQRARPLTFLPTLLTLLAIIINIELYSHQAFLIKIKLLFIQDNFFMIVGIISKSKSFSLRRRGLKCCF